MNELKARVRVLSRFAAGERLVTSLTYLFVPPGRCRVQLFGCKEQVPISTTIREHISVSRLHRHHATAAHGCKP